MSKIFFYGLFMNQALLAEKGLHPETIGSAVLFGYRLHIGDRATLLPSPASRVYGVVMELPDQEAHVLYSEPSVRAYEREPVRVTLLASSQVVDAYCYNLPRELALIGTNPDYAQKLARLVEALRLDATYAREIAALGEH